MTENDVPSGVPNREMPLQYPQTNIASSHKLERVVSLSLILALAAVSVETREGDDRVRIILLTSAAALAAISWIVGPYKTKKGNAKVQAVAGLYFLTAGLLSFSRGEATAPLLYGVAFLLTYSAGRTEPSALLGYVRVWLTLLALVLLLPALMGDGFESGRTWVAFMPGRYFGWSNPNALGFLGGLLTLLAVTSGKRRHLGLSLITGVSLFTLSSSFTALFAICAAALGYAYLRDARSATSLQWAAFVTSLSAISALSYVHTPQFLGLLQRLQGKLDMSNRTLIWVDLVQRSRSAGTFWTGIGDEKVGRLTNENIGVATAHMTWLQLLLSVGFLLTCVFTLVVLLSCVEVLGNFAKTFSPASRATFAVVLYWFAVSWASSMPGTPIGLALVSILCASRPKAVTILSDDRTEMSGAVSLTTSSRSHSRENSPRQAASKLHR